jgi:hypothetical protein
MIYNMSLSAALPLPQPDPPPRKEPIPWRSVLPKTKSTWISMDFYYTVCTCLHTVCSKLANGDWASLGISGHGMVNVHRTSDFAKVVPVLPRVVAQWQEPWHCDVSQKVFRIFSGSLRCLGFDLRSMKRCQPKFLGTFHDISRK